MAKYEDAPTEIAQAIRESTTIKEPHMPQPEITFRHGLCSASVFEDTYNIGDKKTDRSNRHIQAFLSG